MSFFNRIKDKIINGFRTNLSLAVCSVVLAVIAWFVISMTLYPSIPKTIQNIPLSIDITGTSAAENGLSLISCDVETVDVKILGNRAQIGNLNEENVKARIVADNITSTGTKSLSIHISCDNPNIEFQVESITPETATVVLDKFEDKEIPIEPSIPNISFAPGKTVDRDNFSCDPETIIINGPSAQLEKIASCKAVANKELILDSSYTITSDEFVLYTEDGATVDQSPFKFNVPNVTIKIPVLTQKTVGLSVGIAGAPTTFDNSVLKFRLSADSITLASTSNQLTEFPDTFEVGKILLSDLDLGFTQTFTIDTMDFTNMSNLEQVTVTLDDTGLTSKEFTIDNFNITNAPENYDFSVTTKAMKIKIVGPEEVIADITSSDIVADINLLNANIPEGESFNWDATISFPKHDNVWAVTRNKVILSKTEKTSEASDTAEEAE